MKALLEVTARGIIEVDLDDEQQLEDAQGALAGGPADLDTFVSRNSIELTNFGLCDGLVFKVVSLEATDPECDGDKQ